MESWRREAQYEARVSNDIDTGLRIFAKHGYQSPTMAMPFGETQTGYLGNF